MHFSLSRGDKILIWKIKNISWLSCDCGSLENDSIRITHSISAIPHVVNNCLWANRKRGSWKEVGLEWELQSLQFIWHLLEWLWSKLFNRSALCCTSLSALLFLLHCFLMGAWRWSTWSKRIIQVYSWSGRRNKTDGAEGIKKDKVKLGQSQQCFFFFLLSA